MEYRARNSPFVERAKTVPGVESLWVQRTPGFCRLAAIPEASRTSKVCTVPSATGRANFGVAAHPADARPGSRNKGINQCRPAEYSQRTVRARGISESRKVNAL